MDFIELLATAISLLIKGRKEDAKIAARAALNCLVEYAVMFFIIATVTTATIKFIFLLIDLFIK